MNCQVLAFSTEDCPACDIAKPIIKGLARKYGISVQELDPTNEIELAHKYNVAILPTFVLLNENGERYTRPATKHELKYLRQWETGKSKADEEAAMERALRGEES